MELSNQFYLPAEQSSNKYAGCITFLSCASKVSLVYIHQSVYERSVARGNKATVDLTQVKRYHANDGKPDQTNVSSFPTSTISNLLRVYKIYHRLQIRYLVCHKFDCERDTKKRHQSLVPSIDVKRLIVSYRWFYSLLFSSGNISTGTGTWILSGRQLE